MEMREALFFTESEIAIKVKAALLTFCFCSFFADLAAKKRCMGVKDVVLFLFSILLLLIFFDFKLLDLRIDD